MKISRAKFIVFITAVILVLGYASPAICQLMSMGMMRCGPEVIQNGDSMYLVKQRCGEPMTSSVTGNVTSGAYAGGRHGGSYEESTVQTTVMIYDCGGTDFVYRLTFTGDALTYIQSIGRGSGSGGCR